MAENATCKMKNENCKITRVGRRGTLLSAITLCFLYTALYADVGFDSLPFISAHDRHLTLQQYQGFCQQLKYNLQFHYANDRLFDSVRMDVEPVSEIQPILKTQRSLYCARGMGWGLELGLLSGGAALYAYSNNNGGPIFGSTKARLMLPGFVLSGGILGCLSGLTLYGARKSALPHIVDNDHELRALLSDYNDCVFNRYMRIIHQENADTTATLPRMSKKVWGCGTGIGIE
jgi:hypothetical protein